MSVISTAVGSRRIGESLLEMCQETRGVLTWKKSSFGISWCSGGNNFAGEQKATLPWGLELEQAICSLGLNAAWSCRLPGNGFFPGNFLGIPPFLSCMGKGHRYGGHGKRNGRL